MPVIARKKSPEEWVKDLQELKEHADRSRYLAWNRWNEAWRVYNNQYDFSGKAKWQAKNFVPKLSMTVEMAASLVRRAMMDANEWFRFEGTNEVNKPMAPLLEKMAYYYLDLLRFVDAFVPPMKGGLVGSLIVVKPHLAPYTLADESPDDLEKRERGEKVDREVREGPAITVSYPDPYNIWLDGSGRDLFIIEEEEMDMSVAYDLADMGVLDGDVLKKIQEDWTESEKEAQTARRKQQTVDAARPSYRTELKLTHFWGSLPQKMGRWAIRNGHFVMANDKYIIRSPMDNPYSHRQKPYVVGSPFRRPFSVYNKGLIEDVVGLQRAMTELLNLTLDSALFAGIKAFEVDLDQIEDPQQILNGIYPGKVFTGRKGDKSQPMVRDIEIGGVSRDVAEVYRLLDSEFQNSTAVTEFISGAVGAQQNRTATEVVSKQQQGMGIFGEMARNIEGTVLEPMLEQIAHLIVEFHEDFTDPATAKILGPELSIEMMLAAPDQRLEKFRPDDIRVRADGISSLINRTQEIEKVNALLQSIGQLGPMAGAMLADIDVPYFFKNLFRRMVRAYGWNEKDLIREKSEEEKAAEAAAAQAPQPGAVAAPPGASAQPGQPVPPALLQTAGQMGAIENTIAGGGVAPSPMAQ
jgi:hypothetical protein